MQGRSLYTTSWALLLAPVINMLDYNISFPPVSQAKPMPSCYCPIEKTEQEFENKGHSMVKFKCQLPGICGLALNLYLSGRGDHVSADSP